MQFYYLISEHSGEKVAELAEFSDGRVAVRWQRQGFPGSSVWWDSMADARTIHEGQGAWRILSLSI